MQKKIDTLLSLGPDGDLLPFLINVFPSIPPVTLTERVREFDGTAIPTFSLVMEFHSSWRPDPSRSSGMLSLSPPLAYCPDFRADGYIEEEKESNWWLELANTIQWQVPDPSPDNDTWLKLLSASLLDNLTYTPCSADWVGRLVSPEAEAAFNILSFLPAYSKLVDLAANDSFQDICANVVLTLASHGMAAPGAVAWAHEYSTSHPTYQVSLRAAIARFPKLSSSIWTAWNNALFAFREESAAPRPNRVVIDVDASSVAPSSPAAPEQTPLQSITDTPVSPSVSRATKTSRGSKLPKTRPYPGSKLPDTRRASDDDVRIAQTIAKRPCPLPPTDEIIELTSDSDAHGGESELGTPTVKHAPSPNERAMSPASDKGPWPHLMSPSVVSPRKTRSAKASSKSLAANKYGKSCKK